MRVVLDDVTVAYDDMVAVREFALEIADGEMVVLLGPSGCGKTSAMRSIVGLETPTHGAIRIGDNVVFDASRGVNVPTNHRRVGMVFQSYAIWPHKTVFENVVFPMRVAGDMSRGEIRRRGHELLEMLGLAEHAAKGASMLSGGQMQRVALARSLAMQPRVLLLDEPLSNLDASLRDRLRFELKEIQNDVGITALYVTHDLYEALALADRIAVMQAGRLVQVATPKSIYENPTSAFVADVLGVTNLFPVASCEKAGDQRTKVRIEPDLTFESSFDPPGSGAVVAIRPDRIAVSAEHPVGVPNTFAGTLTVSSYLGNQVRYKVRVADAVTFDVASTDVEGQIPLGARVFASVAAADVQLLGDGT